VAELYSVAGLVAIIQYFYKDRNHLTTPTVVTTICDNHFAADRGTCSWCVQLRFVVVEGPGARARAGV
jgi:hypothetical protein